MSTKKVMFFHLNVGTAADVAKAILGEDATDVDYKQMDKLIVECVYRTKLGRAAAELHNRAFIVSTKDDPEVEERLTLLIRSDAKAAGIDSVTWYEADRTYEAQSCSAQSNTKSMKKITRMPAGYVFQTSVAPRDDTNYYRVTQKSVKAVPCVYVIGTKAPAGSRKRIQNV